MSDIAKRIASLSPEQRALLKMRLGAEQQQHDGAARVQAVEPVAIIGMGCRFPHGANNPDAFWELIKNGVDGVTEVPAERWKADAFYDANPGAPGKMSTRWGGFLNAVEDFDYGFFGITPREATQMDPQQRLLLEVAWEALEDAGLPLERLTGSATGIFVGISTSDYSLLQLADRNSIDAYTSSGSALSIAANRVSFMFDLRGPSVAVDTACSSSLVAAHLACQSLRNRECDVALTGGVNLLLSPLWTISLSKWGVMAADGRCKAFDSRADGFVRGEGCGVVVLKRLADAVASGDNVLAVIRGSAVNQDGRSTGLTAPNGPAQEAVVRQALDAAGIAPAQISYVEAHGTGTALGDPIEIEALSAVLGAEGRDRSAACVVGSVKTNIGHLEAAAGIAGLIKTVLAIKHEAIPPNLHFRELNPLISTDAAPFVFPTELRAWPSNSARRFAGVSSFGFGGTNAHLILEEPPRVEQVRCATGAGEEGAAYLLPLSARDAQALRSLAEAYREFLSNDEIADAAALRDICYSAGVRRAHHDHRLAIAGRTRAEMAEGLEAFLLGEKRTGVVSGEKVSGRGREGIVWVFSGQGSQWHGMGRELLKREPVYRRSIEACDEALKKHAGWSLLAELEADESRSRLAETEVAQPTIFAIQIALAALWRAWGIEPDAVVGHSLGEMAAAHVAGILSLEDAMRVVYQRSRLMQRATGGGTMVAVELTAAEAIGALAGHEDHLSVAAINAPRSVVLSGASDALAEVVESLKRRNVYCRALEVNYAFHSPQMLAFERELVQSLGGLAPRAASVQFFSTVTGNLMNGSQLDASYWGRNMVEPVRFADAVSQLLENGFETFVEISPRPVLSASISESLRAREREGQVLASMRRNVEPQSVLLGSLGALYARGHDVDWQRLDAEPGRFVRLPAYPWQRERCWIENGERDGVSVDWGRVNDSTDEAEAHPFLRRQQILAHPKGTHLWTIEITPSAFEYLQDHRIQHVVVLPGTAYAEMVLASSSKSFGDGARVLKELEFQKALFLPASGVAALQLFLSPLEDGEATFRIYSRGDARGADESDENWTLNVTGKLSYRTPPARTLDTGARDEIKRRCRDEIAGDEFYALMADKGNQWGACFQGIERLWKGDGEVIGEIRAPQLLESQLERYEMHPAIADACGQVLAITRDFDERESRNRGAFMGGGVSEVRFYKHPLGGRLWSHARVRNGAEAGASVLEGDASVFDETGQLVVEFIGIRFRYLEQGTLRAAPQNLDNWFYEIRWELKNNLGVEHSQASRNDNGTPCASSDDAAPGVWMIFADRCGVGHELADALAARGEKSLLISQGERFQRIDEARFEIRAAESEDMRRLFDAALAPGQSNKIRVVQLWSLDAPAPAGLTASTLVAAQHAGCGSVPVILKELVRPELNVAPRLWLVTRGAQPVGESVAAVNIAQSPVWGLGRSLAHEHPALWGGLVDADPDAPAQEVAAMLLREMLNADGEDQIAFRDGARYVARLVRHSPKPVRGSASFRLRANASYLVTGGLGDLGLHVARWMVEQGARRLVLAARAGLPPRSTWGAVEPGTVVAKRVAAVRELEEAGASVHLAQFDVADETQVRAFLDEFRAECWPPLRGVVPAAGVMDYRPVAETECEDLDAVLRPKTVGAWLLHSLLEDASLDFFILFSSMASMLNSPLVGSYAAANAFLDALAHHRRAKGLPALSINWGPWEEIGMAARHRAPRNGHAAPQEMGSIAPGQGLEALEQLLSDAARAQVGVMPVEWRKWRQLYPSYTDTPLLAHLIDDDAPDATLATSATGEQSSGDRLTRERLLSESHDARATMLEHFVREQVGAVMGLPVSKLDVEKPLSQIGIDSLMAVELKNRMEVSLRTVLPMVHFLKGPSIRKLSTLLLEQVVSANGADAGAAGGATQTDAEDEWEVLKI